MAIADSPDSGWFSTNMPPGSQSSLSGGYKQVATAPDGVPVFQNTTGQFFTQNADGTYTQQFQGGKPDWLTQATGGGGATPPATGGGGGGRSMDDGAIGAFVSQLAAMPGADPSLASNPAYWVGRIKETGGLGDDNKQWWQNAGVGETAFFRNPNRESGGAAAGGNRYGAMDAGGFGAPPAPYASNPNAPSYTAPTPTGQLANQYVAPQFKAPSVEEVESRPGFQIGLKYGAQGIERAAASKGTVLNPGTVQALARNATDYAGNRYDTVLGQEAGIFGMNASNALAGRQQNQNEFQQNVVGGANTTFQNQYASYLNDNARTLQDYLTNYNIQHTADTDYWGRLKDVSGAGLQASLGDRAA